MCGIAGLMGEKQNELKLMLDSIKHRGPDGEGMEINKQFSIGMRRLSIIDPNGGWQPIYNEDKKICIVMNGEIYNYKELWKELESLGHVFKTDHSDTETVLHGYEEWGYEVLQKIKGMFAFAIWDSKLNKLFIARDRLGIKPLYYTSSPFAFSSEIKALKTLPSFVRDYDEEAVNKFLYYRVHDSTENTFFKGIKRLMPGSFMIIGKDGIEKIQKYWYPKYNAEFKSEKSDDDYATEFYQIFKKTIKRHLISDVPVGVSLSGGLDSSGVVCVMKELIDEGENLNTNGKLHTFSALYPNESIDESEYIKEVEKRVNSTPIYTYPTSDKFWEEINEWVMFQEEPTISSAPYAYYNVYREASKYVKVMLSGNGGDELLAGYYPYFKTYAQSALQNLQFITLTKELIKSPHIYSIYLKEIVNKLIPDNHVRLSVSEFLNMNTSKYVYPSTNNLNERLFNDVTHYSTPNLLRYEDKNSMAFSIESRVPFLDSDLVEYIFSLPIDQKMKNGYTRFVYRNAMKGHMPDLNRLRKSKIGFTNPELKWMKLKSKNIREIFSSDKFKQRNIYSQENILDKFDKWLVDDKAKGDGLIFWRILITELWMRNFLD